MVPPEKFHAHDVVIDDAENIVLAKTVSFEPPEADPGYPYERTGIFKFTTIEILKGTAPDNFYIHAYIYEIPSTLWTSFLKYTFWYSVLNHSDDLFWEEKIGRVTSNNSMCTIVPDFSVGSTYLIIEGKKQDSKDYELITFEPDKWLLYVKNRLKLKKTNNANAY